MSFLFCDPEDYKVAAGLFGACDGRGEDASGSKYPPDSWPDSWPDCPGFVVRLVAGFLAVARLVAEPNSRPALQGRVYTFLAEPA